MPLAIVSGSRLHGYDFPTSPPAWIPASGEVAEISLNTLDDVDPAGGSTQPWTEDGHRNVVDAWNGGAFAPGYSTLGGYLIHGGGHGAYYGNEVYAFNLDSQLWECINEPTYPWDLDYTEGELQPDEPMSTHTYGHVQYDSTYGTKGGFALLVHTSNHDQSGGFTGRSHICDLATGTWDRLSTNTLGSGSEGTSARDVARNQFYYLGQGFAPLAVINSSRAWVTRSTSIGPWNLGHVMGFDSTGDLIVVFDPVRSDAEEIYCIDPADATGAEVAVDVTGTAPTNNSGSLEYVASKDAFYYWSANGNRLQIFKLKPPAGNKAARLAGTWTWSSETLSLAGGSASIPAPVNGNPAYSRWRFAPSINCFLVVMTTTSAVYCFNHPDF